MNLVEIAKSCGAKDYTDCYAKLVGENICMTPDQLHAYTEQVCTERLKELETALAINVECSVYENSVLPTLTAHKQMMGDRHE